MSPTVSPEPSRVLGRFTQAVRLLEEAGVTDQDWQQIIDDPSIRRSIVKVFHPDCRPGKQTFQVSSDFRLAETIGVEQAVELAKTLLGISDCDWIRSIDDLRHWQANAPQLCDWQRIRPAFRSLPLSSQVVLAKMYGLTGEPPMTTYEISRELEINIRLVRQYSSYGIAELKRALVRSVNY